MKKYTFDIDITGKAVIVVRAETEEEACQKFKELDGETTLIEWEFDFPFGFEKMDSEDLLDFLSGVDEEDSK